MSSYVYAAKVGNKVILFDAGARSRRQADRRRCWAGCTPARGDITDVFFYARPRRPHRAARRGCATSSIRLGAGDIALAEKKVPPEALAGKAITTVMGFPAVTAADPLTGAATIDVGDAQRRRQDAKKVKAFPIPGHTPGSYAFLYDGVLFVGDAMMFKQGRLDPAIKLFDAHPDENKAAIRQLQKQIDNEEIDIICTGHGGCTPKGLGRNQLTNWSPGSRRRQVVVAERAQRPYSPPCMRS